MAEETVSKVIGYLQAIEDDNLDKVKGIESVQLSILLLHQLNM